MFLPYEAAAAICGTKQPPPSHRATHNPLYLHPPPGLPFSVILKPLIGNVNIFPPSSLLLFFCNLYMRLTLKKRGREATFSIKLNMGVFCSFLSRDFTAFEFLSIAYTSFSLPFYQPLFLLDAIFSPFSLSLTLPAYFCNFIISSIPSPDNSAPEYGQRGGGFFSGKTPEHLKRFRNQQKDKRIACSLYSHYLQTLVNSYLGYYLLSVTLNICFI